MKSGRKTKTSISSDNSYVLGQGTSAPLEEEFDYIIARPWDETTEKTNGKTLCIYMVSSQEIHTGTQKEAEATLEYVKSRSKRDTEWRIYKVTIHEAPAT